VLILRLAARYHEYMNADAHKENITPGSGESATKSLPYAVLVPQRDTLANAPSDVEPLACGQIGIGGSLAAAPLPHHRTCGSASGGSVT